MNRSAESRPTRKETKPMLLKNRILALALAGATVLSAAAIPTIAAADEKEHRRNAILLGAAGAVLMHNKQNTLGWIAIGGAAYEAKRLQDDINARHRRESRYRSRYDYDRYGRYDSDRYRNDRYRTTGYTNARLIDSRNRTYRRGDGDDYDRGREWAKSRGKKKGWYKNGKFSGGKGNKRCKD